MSDPMITGITAGSRQSAVGMLREQIERQEKEIEQQKALLGWLELNQLPEESSAEHALWSLLWKGPK